MNVCSSADTTLCIDDFKYRFTDQPNGWFGATVKVDWPILTNLRVDPYERLGMLNGKDGSSIAYYVRLRVLALRVRPAAGGAGGAVVHRFPTDAGRCQFQYGCY